MLMYKYLEITLYLDSLKYDTEQWYTLSYQCIQNWTKNLASKNVLRCFEYRTLGTRIYGIQ